MSGQDEDAAWRAIVENYGERAQVEDEPPPADPEPAPGDDGAGDPGDAGPEPFRPTYADLDAAAPEDPDEGRFVPPVPPPGPRLQLPRHLPWLGVFGSPVVLLVALLTGIQLPGWLGYLLVGGFVGGFVWLVATMNRGGRDPWDDGARL